MLITLRRMGTRETRRQRGRRRGEQLVRRLIGEIRNAREENGVSQRALAAELDWSQSELNRLEQYRFPAVSLPRLCELAAVLGLEVSAGLHPDGDAIRDKGQQPLIGRFTGVIGAPYVISREVLLPLPGDRRSWDILLRREDLLVGVEAETRIRDIQALVRRVRERERDGGVDEILIVLSDTAHNRQLVDQLREALGPRYATSPRTLLAALRAGRPLPGSGVILL
jgi:transcriptional regulator with XRE-family HTH domain